MGVFIFKTRVGVRLMRKHAVVKASLQKETEQMHGPKESDQLQQCDDAYVLLNHSADVYVDMLNGE